MNKFFDYLMPDLPLVTIRELLSYIRRAVRVPEDDIPVEGRMGKLRFCATPCPDGVRVHWVEIGRERIAVDALV